MQDGVVLDERMSRDLRRAMVDNQVRTFDVTDQRVLEAFYTVPRERFLPSSLAALAYSDAQVVLKGGEEGRVLMPPMFLARMLQGATVAPGRSALAVASATGYTAALLAELTGTVVALDSDQALSAAAAETFRSLGLSNVECATGPLAQGHAVRAPYDLIVVEGAVECHLEALFDQLAPQGCLVAIVTRAGNATRRSGKATRYDKVAGEFSPRALFDATVPVLPAFRMELGFVF